MFKALSDETRFKLVRLLRPVIYASGLWPIALTYQRQRFPST